MERERQKEEQAAVELSEAQTEAFIRMRKEVAEQKKKEEHVMARRMRRVEQDKQGRAASAATAAAREAESANHQAFRMRWARGVHMRDLQRRQNFEKHLVEVSDETARPEQNPRPALCGAHS